MLFLPLNHQDDVGLLVSQLVVLFKQQRYFDSLPLTFFQHLSTFLLCFRFFPAVMVYLTVMKWEHNHATLWAAYKCTQKSDRFWLVAFKVPAKGDSCQLDGFLYQFYDRVGSFHELSSLSHQFQLKSILSRWRFFEFHEHAPKISQQPVRQIFPTFNLFTNRIYNLFNIYMSETISYSRLVSIIFKQINKFRENPDFIVDVLEQRSRKYEDLTYYPNNDKRLQIETQEGSQPIFELLSTFNVKTIYPKFIWSYELHCAANERAEEIANSSTHNKSEQNAIEDIVKVYGDWSGHLSEHILYGFCDPKQILCELLIDDGNLERQNRKQLMNPDLHYIGIGINKHQKYQFVVVIILATHAQKKKTQHYHIPTPHDQPQQPLCQACQIC